MDTLVGHRPDLPWSDRVINDTRCHRSCGAGPGMVSGGERCDRSCSSLSCSPLGWNVSALDGWNRRHIDWPADCHAPDCRSSCLDAAVRFFSQRHRYIPYCRGFAAEVCQLGLGRIRWSDYAWTGHPGMGTMAVVGALVSRRFAWRYLVVARLVLCDACSRCTQHP